MKIAKLKPSKNKKPSEGYIIGTGYPIIDDTLENTRGLIPFQETLMQLFAAVCDIPFGSADSVRRIVGKKYSMTDPKQAAVILGVKAQWEDGCKKHGIDKETMEHWWNVILANSGYSFNLSHAVAYSVLTYETLWYRKNFPLEFAVVRLTIKPDEQGFWLQWLSEHDYEVLPPDVQYSDATDYKIHDGKVIMPLTGLKGFGIAAAKEIVENRPYASIADFRERNSKRGVNSSKMIALFMMDCFRNLSGTWDDMQCERELKLNPTGCEIISKKETIVLNSRFDVYKKFLNGAILYTPALAKKMKSLKSQGYSMGIVTDIEAGETQTRKPNKKYYFGGQSYPSLYIGDWAEHKVISAIGKPIEKGDFIAYQVNKKFGRYLEEDNIVLLNGMV